VETNRYASHPLNVAGNTMGGKNWVNLSVAELKAFLVIHMYMGMKWQPSIQTYWENVGSIFHFSTISNIMSRFRFTKFATMSPYYKSHKL
jgi:hypothetical protein